MTSKKITESEAAPLRISSLPTRPTAPEAFGGKGYTSVEMKEAFDKLPTLIIERFNALIDDIHTGDIIKKIPASGSTHFDSLSEVCEGVENGELANAITVFDSTLTALIASMLSDIESIKAAIGLEG